MIENVNIVVREPEHSTQQVRPVTGHGGQN
jgi:hypothetical protein